MNALQQSRLAWYARRLGRMSAGELAWRCRDKIVQAAWSTRQVTTERPEADESARPGQRQFTGSPANGRCSESPERT